MGQPERPDDLDETVLDEGRQRLFLARDRVPLEETLLDPGRRRPDGWEPEAWPDESLPEDLASRYELIRRLELTGSQGELFLVRVRADGSEAVLKRRRSNRQLDPGLAAYLRSPDHHLVRHLEAGRGYEVMVHLPGRTLRERLDTDGRFGYAELHAVVEQLSAGLTSLHREGFVHRDVKPTNVIAGATNPVRLALVDFGIAGPLVSSDWPDRPNPAHQPPEWILLGRVGRETDWWGLGMTVLELASGAHPFKGLTDADIRRHFGLSRGVDVSGIPNDPTATENQRQNRLRNLCLGLLARDPAERWGAEQVGRWLVGENPDLPPSVVMGPAPAGSTDITAEQPFAFDSRDYFVRRDLAIDLATHWNDAARALFDNGGIHRLREWLDQFSDDDGAEARGVAQAVAGDTGEPGDVRLFRLLQAMFPARPAVYRNHVISRRELMTMATNLGEGDHAEVLADLWNFHLLPDLDSSAPLVPETGGEGLTEVDERWRQAHDAWPDMVAQVSDAGARDDLRTMISGQQVLATCLRSALEHPDDRAKVQQQLRQHAAALSPRIPWFDRLVRDPRTIWVALLAHGYASSCATAEATRRRGVRDQEDATRTAAAFREWSSRQNRSTALGWAVAGVSVLTALWFLLITVGDLVRSAGNAAVTLAWVGAALCLPVSLIAECLLAAEIGGRFHSAYSMPGIWAAGLRPMARWMQRSRFLATGVILAALAGTALAAVEFPLLLVTATTIGHLGWVAHRLRAWRSRQRAEDAQIAASELRRPSDTDADLIGAAGGAGS